MSLPALLDVNLLVALFDPDHVHHEAAHAWFGPARAAGWATCPLTQNGLVRILANPAYASNRYRPMAIADRLRRFLDGVGHSFWADEVSLLDRNLFRLEAVGGHRQLTDVYLLGLARRREGRLATFDRSIPLAAVVGARDEHRLIVPA